MLLKECALLLPDRTTVAVCDCGVVIGNFTKEELSFKNKYADLNVMKIYYKDRKFHFDIDLPIPEFDENVA